MMRKAGKLAVGETMTGEAVKSGRAKLLLLASDASENAAKRANNYLTGRRALLIETPFTNEELSLLLGKGGCAMAAVTDIGLAKAFMTALNEEEHGRYDVETGEVKRRYEKAVRRKSNGPKSKLGRYKA